MSVLRFSNPFTPRFGSLPAIFVGRQDIISSFEYALDHPGDKARTIMIEGNRGVGKTSLIKYLGEKAKNNGWTVISLNAGNQQVLKSILSRLGGTQQSNTNISFEPSIGIPQVFEGKLGKIEHYKAKERPLVFHDALENCLCKHNKPVLIVLDEIQSSNVREIAELCGAYQLLSDKYELCLLAAGLPGGYDELLETNKKKSEGVMSNDIHGCSFLQRGTNYVLEQLMPSEMEEMFKKTLALIPNLEIEDGVIQLMCQISRGEPFIAQCLGSESVKEMSYRVGNVVKAELLVSDVSAAMNKSLESYYHDILENMTKHFYPFQLKYLKTASEIGNETGRISTSEVAKRLGKTAKQCSQTRQAVINSGLASPDGRGYLNFDRPYIYEFTHRNPEEYTKKPCEAWEYNKSVPLP